MLNLIQPPLEFRKIIGPNQQFWGLFKILIFQGGCNSNFEKPGSDGNPQQPF